MKKKTKKKVSFDIKDLMMGFGFGLCFSKFYLIGIFLSLLVIIICLVELNENKEEKSK